MELARLALLAAVPQPLLLVVWAAEERRQLKESMVVKEWEVAVPMVQYHLHFPAQCWVLEQRVVGELAAHFPLCP